MLDLGSGTGKICFIAAQIVGPKGKVIGVDMTDEMLEVARRNAPIVAERIGYANVEFRKGRIQDLALDLEMLDRRAEAQPDHRRSIVSRGRRTGGGIARQASAHRERLGRCGRFQLRAQSGRAEIEATTLRRDFPRAQKRRARGDLRHRERRRSAGSNCRTIRSFGAGAFPAR